MIRGLYTSATGMSVNEARMDTLSNNIANVDTTGFKRDERIMESFPDLVINRMERGQRGEEIGELGSGVGIDESYTDFSRGNFQKTDAPLDLALDGDGFFAVQTPEGVRYTRNGDFILNSEGMIVTRRGNPVLGEEGPLQVLPDEQVHVDSNGTVYSGDLEVDDLEIVDFVDANDLEQLGNGLFAQGEADMIEIEDYSVEQGFLEGSNVEIVKEMVDMIQASRHYETNQRVIRAQDETLQQAVNEISSLR